jgi:hypothetical protein
MNSHANLYDFTEPRLLEGPVITNLIIRNLQQSLSERRNELNVVSYKLNYFIWIKEVRQSGGAGRLPHITK